MESRLSMLESRLISGPAVLFAAFRHAFDAFTRDSDPQDFVRRLFDLLRQRHDKYGSSSTLLEPNIKNSAGGLRDLHTAYWVLRGTGFLPPLSARSQKETATTFLLRAKITTSLLRPDILRALRNAFDFLLRARNEMHLRSGTLNDLMAFALQPAIANGLHIRPVGRRSRVEQFMHEYYIASRNVSFAASRIRSWAADRWMRPERWVERRALDDLFELRQNRISLRQPHRRLTNEEAVRAFFHAAEQQTGFSFDLEDVLHRSEHNLTAVKSGPAQTTWRRLLSSSSPIASSLHRMNALGLLERWIPEWKPLVAFFQHNQYHFYTADEHTMLVLANVEDLQTSATTFGDVYRTLPRKDILRWACLLHDIAKPIQLSTHEVAGVPITEKALHRLGYEDIVEDVAFLVRNHLLMEQVAFRRNLNDPQTIHEFAQKFERVEQLDYLYVLTYADLSAVNRNVFTEWKAALLSELHRKASEVLRSRLSKEEYQEQSHRESDSKAKAIVLALSDEFPERLVVNHLSLIDDPSYLAAFSTKDIREHIHLVIRRPLVRARLHHAGNITTVTIVARDAPFALARFCGVLSANDANILDAEIFTRRDGIIIDRFRVADFASRSALTPDQCERICNELEDVFSGRTDLRHLLARHRAKWKRRSRPLNPNIRLDVEFEDHPRFTIVDVYAADTLGFLYRITESMSQLGLNIAFAKIATRGDGIVDSFYVADERGQRITDAGHLSSIRAALIETVKQTAETEMIVGDF
jgi:[protein-PII] uridylyltransferase